MMRLVSIFIFLHLAHLLPGQIISSISLSKDSLIIGDELEIYIAINSSNNQSFTLDYRVFDSIPIVNPNNAEEEKINFAEVEFTEELQIVTPTQATGSNRGYTYRDTLHARIWDTGVLQFSALSIVTSDSTVKVEKLEPAYLLARMPENIVNPDTSKLLMPIKDIIREESTMLDYIWILYVLMAILLMLGLFWLLKPKNKKLLLEIPEELRLPAHLEALDQLKALDSQKLWQSGKIKEFQSQLTHIIRAYLESRYDMPALESTTDEILQKAESDMLFSQNLVNELRNILQIADLIKFAKADPPQDIHQNFLEKAVSFVKQTKLQMSEEEEAQYRRERELYLQKLAVIKGEKP